MKRYFLTGLLVLLPAWGTYLILQALFNTVDALWSDLLGPAVKSDVPGLGIGSILGLILLTGIVATDVIGQQAVRVTDAWVQRIPLVRSIYLTLKGMTDLFHFRSRFGSSTVVVFPFPREGLWALGFVMGTAPPSLRLAERGPMIMVFVPTAIHPFTGYLAFIPGEKVCPINLSPEEAMKMEFSAGLFHPRPGWLTQLRRAGPAAH